MKTKYSTYVLSANNRMLSRGCFYRLWLGVCLAVSITLVATPSWCELTPGAKFKRGAINIITAPVEIPKEVRRYWIQGSEKTFHISAWLVCGVVKGVVNTPLRLVSGVWDVVTFPVQTSATDAPLYSPDYVFDEWPKRQEGVEYKNIWDRRDDH